MKGNLIGIVCFFIACSVQAQNSVGLNRQFFFNPYPFNPAYAGIAGQAEIGVVYRKQWMNFQDAPFSSGVSLHAPVSKRVAIGANMFSQREVLLKSSSFRASFTYVVPLGFRETLRLGLSGGVGIRALNLGSDELGSADPVLVRGLGNYYYGDGNFGVLYVRRELKAGVALTDLFNSDVFRPESFGEFGFSNLKNRLYSLSYRFGPASGLVGVSVEPVLLYRESADKEMNYWEAQTVVYFNDVLWTGAGYHQRSGLSLFMGCNIKDRFRFSYGYGFPPFGASSSGSGVHELQLSMRFGRKFTMPDRITPLMNRYNPPRSSRH